MFSGDHGVTDWFYRSSDTRRPKVMNENDLSEMIRGIDISLGASYGFQVVEGGFNLNLPPCLTSTIGYSMDVIGIDIGISGAVKLPFGIASTAGWAEFDLWPKFERRDFNE